MADYRLTRRKPRVGDVVRVKDKLGVWRVIFTKSVGRAQRTLYMVRSEENHAHSVLIESAEIVPLPNVVGDPPWLAFDAPGFNGMQINGAVDISQDVGRG
jgi:hypothetical protein